MWSTLTRALRTPPASNTPLPYLGLFTHARHKRTNANAPVRYRWWQKTLPALAPAVAATMPGKGYGTNYRKDMQKLQESCAKKARRIEGRKRNYALRLIKRENENKKIMGYFAQYAELLRRKKEAATAASKRPDTPSTTPPPPEPSGVAQPGS